MKITHPLFFVALRELPTDFVDNSVSRFLKSPQSTGFIGAKEKSSTF